MSKVLSLSITNVLLDDCEAFFGEPCIKRLNGKFTINGNDISFIERPDVDNALYHASQDDFYEIVRAVQKHMVEHDACLITMTTDGPVLKIHHDLIVAKDAIEYTMDFPKYHSGMIDRMKRRLDLNIQVAQIKNGLRKANAWFNILSKSELIENQAL